MKRCPGPISRRVAGLLPNSGVEFRVYLSIIVSNNNI